MVIRFNDRGELTVPASWFATSDVIGGKIRATPDGQVVGLIAEWGSTGRGSMTRGVRLAAGNTSLMDGLAQSIVRTEDMPETEGPIEATILAYAADHYDGPALANPLNSMILAKPFLTPKGIGVAGCVHPEAVKRWGLGEAIGRINATPWSLEGARYRDTGHLKIGSVASPGVLGAAVTKPGFVIDRLAASDTMADEGVEAVSFTIEQPEPPAQSAPLPGPVAPSPAPAPSIDETVVATIVDRRVNEILIQREAEQAAQALRDQRAEALRQPLG